MKYAIISDIHANYEALQVVLADIQEQGITRILCLGDIVGYGPNPRECLDAVMRRCEITILGNHDEATQFDPDGFNPVALQAVYWTRDQLEQSAGNTVQRNRRWDFLGELPRMHVEGEVMFVHGSAREPTNEYVFPEDVYKRPKLDSIFDRVTQYCFQGHTHIPGVFTIAPEFVAAAVGPGTTEVKMALPATKAMINVGSVGQPRDNDPRSCYVIVEDFETARYRRIQYDMKVTCDKIYNIPELDNFLGDRLLVGR